MALAGNLSEFSLADIVQLLQMGKQTGGLYIQGRRGTRRLEGWIFFHDGRIIAATAADLPPLDALYGFFSLNSGPFSFHDDYTLPIPTISLPNEAIIMEGAMRQGEQNDRYAQLPALDLIPILVRNPSADPIETSLLPEQWRVLTMVDAQRSIAQLAEQSGLGEYRTREIIAELHLDGLLELYEPSSPSCT